MRKQLESLLARIEALKEKAEETADNTESDKTEERYTAISEHLETAMDSLQSAIDEFEG